MALVTIRFVVDDVATARTLYDRIAIYRSVDDGETFAEITGPGSRLTLLSTQSAYAYVDADGEDNYIYRWTFRHSGSGAESDPSPNIRGEATALVISPADLISTYLQGVPLYDQTGAPFPDSMFLRFINAATAYVEKRLDIPLLPVTYTEAEPDAVDYMRQEYQNYVWLQLKSRPIISVESVRMILPTNQQVVEYDPTWIHPDYDAGTLQIVPGNGTLALGASWFGVMTASWFIPQVFRVAYTAGFRRGTVPADIQHLIGLLASMNVLAVAGDLVGGIGVAQEHVSLDALVTETKFNKTAGGSVFGGRLMQYYRESQQMLQELRRYYKGAPIIVA